MDINRLVYVASVHNIICKAAAPRKAKCTKRIQLLLFENNGLPTSESLQERAIPQDSIVLQQIENFYTPLPQQAFSPGSYAFAVPSVPIRLMANWNTDYTVYLLFVYVYLYTCVWVYVYVYVWV